MIYRFDGFELDTAKREVRSGGAVRSLQPQAFAVLEYLVRHRDRAVPKEELLEKLWPDVVVGDGSLQRAVSLARAATEDDGSRIRTVPKLGYRFVAEVEEAQNSRTAVPSPAFRPKFVRSGDVHVAYHTIGDGKIDLILVPGWAFPMRAFLDHPVPRSLVQELTRFGRVILFDKRGTGLSDRVKQLPDMEQRMDDLRAVLDAVGSREAVLIGYSEGGPLCLLFATSYPERTRGIVLVGSFARWAAGAGYEHGWTPDVIARLRGYIEGSWGAGDTIRAIAESHASDPAVKTWAARAEQEGASPGAALELLEMNLAIDVRELLPLVSVPTVIVHQEQDPVIDVANGRYLAEHIPHARFIVVGGRDHVFLFEDRPHLLSAIEGLLAREKAPLPDRFLATVLVVHVEDRGESIPIDEVVARFRGLAAGPMAWSFDGPQRAIQCAHALLSAWKAQQWEVRAGVHAGEVSRSGAGLVGDGVDVAAAIARAAPPGEVWVSRVVQDLVPASLGEFEEGTDVQLDDGRAIQALPSRP